MTLVWVSDCCLHHAILAVDDFDSQSNIDTCEFILMDITGRVMVNINGEVVSPVDTSNLAPGIYILQIKNSLGIEQQKLVKR